MRKFILTFVLGTLCLGAFSQEAFYIYRNDGDFNGFFYDEVVEMRQSKIGVDSIEYDRWVTQEVVLADTTYRIPLAAIDSIGFQQPEIKLNPRVKFIEKEGMSPYMRGVSVTGMSFENLPADKIPQIGDVWIGLKTDACAELYKTSLGGSFSLVVEGVSIEDGWTYVRGHEVDQISDVFEQYITVEEIGVDENNQIHRRIAGCTPDGLPRHIHQEEGHGDVTVIDFSHDLSYKWDITENTSVSFSADMNLKLCVRAAYNITWKRILVTIKPELSLKVQPTLGLSVKASFEKKLSDVIPLPDGIPFPAAAPIFELCPMPTLFMKAEGTFEASLTLPQMGLGVGMDIIIDSWNIPFVVTGTVHLLEDNPGEPKMNILDLSGEVSMKGTIYTGVEFQMAINTNRWFEKILQAGIGLHFTAGPKVETEFTYSSRLFDGNPYQDYYALSHNTWLKHTWLSLGINAGAKAKVGWSDPDEVTFLEESSDFFITDFRLAHQFHESEAEVAGDYVVVNLNPEPGIALLYHEFSMGIFDPHDTALIPGPCYVAARWDQSLINEDDEFEAIIPLSKFKAQDYDVKTIVQGPDGPTYEASGARFSVPAKIEPDKTIVHFNVAGNNEEIIPFTSNSSRLSVVAGTIDTLNLAEGRYQARMKWYPNRRLFTTGNISRDDPRAPTISAAADHSALHATCPIEVKQDNNDLSNVSVNASVSFGYTQSGSDIEGSAVAQYTGKVTCSRITEGMVEMTGTQTDQWGYTHSISLIVTKNVIESTDDNEVLIYDGTITTKQVVNGLTTYDVSISFEDVGVNEIIHNADGSWTWVPQYKITSGSATYRYKEIDESITTEHYSAKPGSSRQSCSISSYVKVPGED